MKKLSVILGLVCALGAQASSFDTKEAFYLQLNRTGLALSAKELQSQFLTDIQNEPLPDFEEKGWGGIKAKGRGLSYSVDFGELSIVPAAGRLEVAVEIKHVRVEVDSVKFSKKVLVEISSTCEGTAVEVRGPIRVDAHLGLLVQGGTVQVSTPHLNVPLPEDKYHVSGPRKCSGALGVGHIIKLVVKEALKRARKTIEDKVVDRARALVPQLQAKLNAAVIRDIPFEVEKFVPFPDMAPVLRTSPHFLRVDSRGMEFVMNVDVARDSLPVVEGNPFHEIFLDATSVGQAGVNPQLFGEILGKVIPPGVEIGLEEEMVPGIEDALSVEHAAAIWPDLRQVQVTRGHVRPLLSFSAAPKFTVIGDEALVRVSIPLVLRFQIHQDRWRDYYAFKMNLELTTSLDIVNEKLSVSLKPQTVLSLEGEWAASYEPREPYVESEVAEVIFLSLFDVLYAKGALLKVDVPKMEFGGSTVTLRRPHVAAPYIRVGLDSQNR